MKEKMVKRYFPSESRHLMTAPIMLSLKFLCLWSFIFVYLVSVFYYRVCEWFVHVFSVVLRLFLGANISYLLLWFGLCLSVLLLDDVYYGFRQHLCKFPEGQCHRLQGPALVWPAVTFPTRRGRSKGYLTRKPADRAKLGLVNASSVALKAEILIDHIDTYNLDLLEVTET
jgi:hypothetical protein